MKRQSTPIKRKSPTLKGSGTPNQIESYCSVNLIGVSAQKTRKSSLCDIRLKTLEEFIHSKFVVDRSTSKFDHENHDSHSQTISSAIDNKKTCKKLKIRQISSKIPATMSHHGSLHECWQKTVHHDREKKPMLIKLSNAQIVHRSGHNSNPTQVNQYKHKHLFESRPQDSMQVIDKRSARTYGDLMYQSDNSKESKHGRRNSFCLLIQEEKRNSYHEKPKTGLRSQSKLRQTNNNDSYEYKKNTRNQKYSLTFLGNRTALHYETPNNDTKPEKCNNGIFTFSPRAKEERHSAKILCKKSKEDSLNDLFDNSPRKRTRNSKTNQKLTNSLVTDYKSPALNFSNISLRDGAFKKKREGSKPRYLNVLNKSNQERNFRTFSKEFSREDSKAESFIEPAKNALSQNKKVKLLQRGISQLFRDDYNISTQKKSPDYNSFSSLLSSMNTTLLKETIASRSHLYKKTSSEDVLKAIGTLDNLKPLLHEDFRYPKQRAFKLYPGSQNSLLDSLETQDDNQNVGLKAKFSCINETVEKVQESISKFQDCFDKMNQMISVQEEINNKISTILAENSSARESENLKNSERDTIDDYHSNFDEKTHLETQKSDYKSSRNNKKVKMDPSQLDIE